MIIRFLRTFCGRTKIIGQVRRAVGVSLTRHPAGWHTARHKCSQGEDVNHAGVLELWDERSARRRCPPVLGRGSATGRAVCDLLGGALDGRRRGDVQGSQGHQATWMRRHGFSASLTSWAPTLTPWRRSCSRLVASWSRTADGASAASVLTEAAAAGLTCGCPGPVAPW